MIEEVAKIFTEYTLIVRPHPGEKLDIYIKKFKDIRNIFGNKYIFEYPKPSVLSEFLVQIATSKNDLILDFFLDSIYKSLCCPGRLYCGRIWKFGEQI